MHCSNCGTELLEGSRFCRQCGAPVAGPPAAHTDAELEALAAGGDREAFAELYNRHFDHVYDFLRRMLRDPDEAADLAQETFLRAMHALSPKETKASFSTWLFTIARNLALKRLERQRRLAALPEREGEQPAVFHQVDPDRLADPAQAAEAGELSGLVWQAAAALSPKEYSLLDLHVRQGLDSAEIAQVLGVSKGNAYTMMSRLKDSFEGAVVAFLLVQRGRRQCGELDRLLEEQRITVISPAARHTIDRHVAQCPRCQEQRERLVSPTALFGALAAVAVPLGLKPRIGEALAASWAEAAGRAAGAGLQVTQEGLAGKTGAAVTGRASKLWALAGWKAAAIVVAFLVGAGGSVGGWLALRSEESPPEPRQQPAEPAAVALAIVPTSTAGAAYVERIAYIGPDANVWTVSPNGRDASRLTANGDNGQPAWSPDGATLAYIHNRREVHLVRPDGSGDSVVSLSEECDQLVDIPEPQRSGLRFSRVRFTPDGKGLRLGVDWGGVANQFICHIPLDPAVPTLPTVNGDEFDVNAVDGRLIATLSGQGCASMDIVELDGKNRRRIGPTMGSGCTHEPEELSVYPYAPTWSPDGRKLAVYGVSLRENRNEVYVLDVEGNLPPRPLLSVSPPSDFQGGSLGLSWSPDGSKIAYEDEGKIWMVDSDGTGAPTAAAAGYHPSWGQVPNRLAPTPTAVQPPAGFASAQLAFWSDREPPGTYLLNADGTELRRIGGVRPLWSDAVAQWSPDGTKLAFVECPNDQRGANGAELYVMNADGSGLTNVSNHAANDVVVCGSDAALGFSWSPDGSRIVFYSWREPRGLYVVNADGRNITYLTDGTHPQWSPLDNFIVFVGETDPSKWAADIYVVAPDGSNKHLLATVPCDWSLLSECENGPVRWSPDGSLLAFSAVPERPQSATASGANSEIYVLQADGTGLARITNHPATDTNPVWVDCRLPTVGCEARVTNVQPQWLNVRKGPGTGEGVISKLSEGDIVCLLGLPAFEDGYKWWPVHAADGTEGWAAAFEPKQPGSPWLTPTGKACSGERATQTAAG
jgi:RNA polymerase sigma factor (sigma-70 family)